SLWRSTARTVSTSDVPSRASSGSAASTRATSRVACPHGMPQAASERCGGRAEAEERGPAAPCGGGGGDTLDYSTAKSGRAEWQRKTRERSARASMLARAREEDTEGETQHHSQARAPEEAKCRCWHCAATSPTT